MKCEKLAKKNSKKLILKENSTPPVKVSSKNSFIASPKDALHPGERQGRFPIVGIGASAGGLEAFTQLLSNLPTHTGMAFLLIQHLDPKHESMSTEILSRTTQMKVTEAKQGMRVKPNCV